MTVFLSILKVVFIVDWSLYGGVFIAVFTIEIIWSFSFSGLIEVELQEDDGGEITLIGYPVVGDNSGQRSGKRLQRSSPKPYERGTSPNSSGSETDNAQSPVLKSRNKRASRSDNSYRWEDMSKCINIENYKSIMHKIPTAATSVFNSFPQKWQNDQT